MIKGWVPDEIAARPKKGFTPPVLEWTRAEKYGAMVRAEVEEARRSRTLDPMWVDFYETEVLPKDDALSRSMRLRMLAFGQWRKTWFKS
jgi:hypothetical protein